MEVVPQADAEAIQTREAIEREKADLGIPSDPEIVPKEETPETPTVVVQPEDKPEEVEPAKPEEVAARPLTPEEGKELKRFKSELQDNLQKDFDAKFEKLKTELGQKKPDEEKTATLEEDVRELAKKLNFDEEKTRSIIEVARKGLVPLSAEDKQIIEDFKKSKQENTSKVEQMEQEQLFEAEFTTIVPTLKEQFPNATDEQLAKVKADLDIISHSEKYHELDMSEIVTLTLNKEFKFVDPDTNAEIVIQPLSKTLFSPKQKTFESSHAAAPIQDEVGELPDFNPDWTPAQVETWEKRRQNIMDSSGHEPLHIITSDDRGRAVERTE